MFILRAFTAEQLLQLVEQGGQQFGVCRFMLNQETPFAGGGAFDLDVGAEDKGHSN